MMGTVGSRMAALGCGMATILLLASTAHAVRGYTARPCGFDLNFNGVSGESADCNACDGVTTDVDGNGVADDQRYVDCNAGADSGACTPGAPCRTLQFALNALGAPAANQIQAVCFRGTCGGSANLSQSGAAGSVTRARSGSEAIAFNYPRYPLILSGWDSDNDGQYPPADAQDVAVLDGNLSGNTTRALSNDGSASNLQVAHFAARDYGLACGSDGGFMKMTGSSGSPARIYVHDLKLTDILRGCANGSNLIVFNFFNQGSLLTYAAIENVEMDGFGSFFVRGTGNLGSGPYRFEGITAKARGANGDAVAGFKLWNETNGIEIIDSVFDANVATWTPLASGGAPSYAITAAQCTRDWTIRNNLIRDWKQGINVQPYAGGSGFCESRSITDVLIDGNEIRNAYAPWLYGDSGIWIEGGLNATATVQDVTISNNFLSSATGWESCIRSAAGYDAASCSNPIGTITIVGNTCYGDINRHAGLVIGDPEYGESTCSQDTYDVRNNIFAGMGAGETAICTTYPVSGWSANNNVYDGNAGNQYAWNASTNNCGNTVTLSAWRSGSGGDANARTCDPQFVNAAAGDFHVLATDTCTKDTGVSLAGIVTTDIDGQQRPQGAGWDAGADEVAAAGGTPPAAPTLIEVVPINF